MSESDKEQPPGFRLSKLFWIGVAIFALGSGPLLLLLLLTALRMTRDPNPNPIGLGIMVFFTFWPG